MKSFYSSGKILLIGEYAVTKGVEALTLPVLAGQWMHVWAVPAKGVAKLTWQSKELDGSVWFECKIDTDIMHVTESTDDGIAKTLIRILREIHLQKPGLFDGRMLRIENECEFNRDFGLGSSSSLIGNLSKWSGVDGQLLQRTGFGGSGYDTAVALVGKPLIYWLEGIEPNWSSWKLSQDMTATWFLAFPGQKQNSRKSLEGVSVKLEALAQDTMLLQQLNTIVAAVKNPRSLPLMEAMIEMWQALLSQSLDLPRAWESLEITPIPGGLCKWLGAWGGDVLLINKTTLNAYPGTFEQMELKPWNAFVVNS